MADTRRRADHPREPRRRQTRRTEGKGGRYMRIHDVLPTLPRAIALAVALTTIVALGGPPLVTADGDARGRRCGESTLRGDYAFSIDGQILAGPRAGLLRGVAMTHFDGEGGLSQVDFTTINGVPTGTDWRPGTGSYEVDEDCTGRAQISFADGSPTLRLRLVVADRGDQVRTIVEGNATGSIGTRVR
jgi:hypothetical protein